MTESLASGPLAADGNTPFPSVSYGERGVLDHLRVLSREDHTGASRRELILPSTWGPAANSETGRCHLLHVCHEASPTQWL